jgi:ABC-type multidrug transport system ATPase subunit
MICVCNVWLHYGIRPVLRDVSLEVATGEVVVLLGPNGMGKTTLLSCMAGAIAPQRGHVEFDGFVRRSDADGERALRRRIAYLPDDTWLPWASTGREFLLAVGRLYEIDEFRLFDHADRLLQLFQLKEKADSPIRSYSTGQRKKVALASALITEAPCLLLDEPFSGGLDPAGILATKRVLKHLAADDKHTIVLTTPVPELVEEIADRVAIVSSGRLAHCDTPARLKESTGSATLEEALQKLTDPKVFQDLDRYFAGIDR